MLNTDIPGIFRDKAYWKTLVVIGLPVALQNLFSASLNLIDNLMVSGLGDRALASVGFANTVFFLLIVIIFGVGSGSAVFVAQYFGRNDHSGIKKTLALGFLSALCLSVIFTILTLIFAKQIIGIFTTDQETIRLGSEYLQIVSISYPLTAVANLFYSGLRSTKRAVMPFAVSLISIVTNTVLNAILINGLFGAPALGVKGAAIATLVARIVEFTVLVLIIYARKYLVAVYPRNFSGIRKDFVREMLVVSIPVVANEFFWALGVSTYTALYGHMGTAYATAYSIMQTIDRVSFALLMGIASASAAMVGHKIGEGKPRHAFVYAARTNAFGSLLGLVTGILLILFSGTITSYFRVSEDARSYAQLLIILFGIVLPIKTFNLENLLGAMRAGGDTRFAFVAELVPLWLFSIPMAFAAGRYWGAGLIIVYLLTVSDEFIKAVIGFFRFMSRKWIHVLPGADAES